MQGGKRCTSGVPAREGCRNETSVVTYVDGSKTVKLTLNKTHLAQVTENVAGFCEYGIELSGSIIWGTVLD
jgi:hypothetical protein